MYSKMKTLKESGEDLALHDVIFDASKLKIYVKLKDGVLNTFPYFNKLPVYIKSFEDIRLKIGDENSAKKLLNDDYIASTNYCFNFGNIDSEDCKEYINQTDELNKNLGGKKLLLQFQSLKTLLDFCQDEGVYKLNNDRAILFFSI
jgi:hypothetical protein